MKKLTALLIITSIFLVGCVTTNNSSYSAPKGGVPTGDFPVFEEEYYNLIQFDSEGNYDEAATNEALDLLFINHRAIKTISYDTPLGKATTQNPYHNKDVQDSLFIMNDDTVDREKTMKSVGDFHMRYQSLTLIQLTQPNGDVWYQELNSIIDKGKMVTTRTLSGTRGYTEGYNFENPMGIEEFSLKVGEITTVTDPTISKYSFVYYVPDTEFDHDTMKILFVGNGLPRAEYEKIIFDVTRNMDFIYKSYAKKYGYAIISVVVPQEAQYLNERSMIPGEIENDFWKRPDLEYIKVIDAFTEIMTTEGFDVHEKVFMTGFSNGGIQSNIFPILHPEYVEATAIGAAGSYLIPNNDYDWPLGLANAHKIEGFEFDVDEYKNVESLIFVGGEDRNDPVDGDRGDGAEYVKIYGETPYERVPIYADFLRDFGFDVKDTVYEGLGHEYSDEMISDIFDFFEAIEVETKPIALAPVEVELDIKPVKMTPNSIGKYVLGMDFTSVKAELGDEDNDSARYHLYKNVGISFHVSNGIVDGMTKMLDYGPVILEDGLVISNKMTLKEAKQLFDNLVEEWDSDTKEIHACPEYELEFYLHSASYTWRLREFTIDLKSYLSAQGVEVEASKEK